MDKKGKDFGLEPLPNLLACGTNPLWPRLLGKKNPGSNLID